MNNIEKAKAQLKKAQLKLSKVEKQERANARAARNHGLYCLAGAVLKFKPEIADEVLAIVAMNNSPAGHAPAIQFVIANRLAVVAEVENSK